MAKHEQLNNIDHAKLRVIAERGEGYGDNVWYALTFPWEFRAVQSSYPILFQKNKQTGKYLALALFGFEEGENLFLRDNRWAANYIPLMIQKEPFLIGQKDAVNEFGEPYTKRVVHVDVDSPRLSETEGLPLFTELGAESPYMEKMARALETIHQGLLEADEFFAALEQFDLIEPLTLEIKLNNGAKHRVVGFSTINEEKLNSLSAEQVADLHSRKLLAPIYMAIGSLSQVSVLIDERNRREHERA